MLKTPEYYKNIIENEPSNSEAKLFLGLSLLRDKQYKLGWEYFEHRLDGLNSLFPDFFPLWQGENISNKTILVYAERGFGDTIMFSRFLPLLTKRCQKVLFMPQEELCGIFNESELSVKFVKKSMDEFFHVHTSLMSLPYKLKLEKESDIPPVNKNYFSIDKIKSKDYKDKYFANNSLKIGINWQGTMKPTPIRSIPLEFFNKILTVPNSTLYSLQTGCTEEQKKILEQNNIVNLGTTFFDFSDTIAAMANLDIIISNDTSVANLAGAIEKKCFILLPYQSDWRWGDDISSCIWYSTVQLLRQSRPHDWSGVFDELLNILMP